MVQKAFGQRSEAKHTESRLKREVRNSIAVHNWIPRRQRC
jgi:hypothetical protein